MRVVRLQRSPGSHAADRRVFDQHREPATLSELRGPHPRPHFYPKGDKPGR